MRRTARFLPALAVALVLMLCFRALALTIYTVDGKGLSPLLTQGDRVLVNRWSYGLRVGGKGSFFGYGRLLRQPVERGDIVAFEHPDSNGEVLFCRCTALPGDTLLTEDGETLVVPGKVNCADADHYWMEAIGPQNATDSRTLGFIAEQFIIGRAFMVVYSHNPKQPFWQGWRPERSFLPL